MERPNGDGGRLQAALDEVGEPDASTVSSTRATLFPHETTRCGVVTPARKDSNLPAHVSPSQRRTSVQSPTYLLTAYLMNVA